MLIDREWKLKYTPEDGDLVRGFYIPALEDAERYDRLTGYFNAGALVLAARGIEGLVRNNCRMRLVVGCTLGQPEIDAIEKGEAVREQVEKHLADMPLIAPDAATKEALELVSWMVAQGYLEVKVAVPCDEHRNPVPDNALFHEKTGIIEDRGGDRIAWTGSLNETAAGWRRNWETINVFKSWGPERDRVDEEERNFASLWASRPSRVIVIDVPEAVRRDLLRFMPADGMPRRLRRAGLGLYTTAPNRMVGLTTPSHERIPRCGAGFPGSAGVPPAAGRRPAIVHAGGTPALPEGRPRAYLHSKGRGDGRRTSSAGATGRICAGVGGRPAKPRMGLHRQCAAPPGGRSARR